MADIATLVLNLLGKFAQCVRSYKSPEALMRSLQEKEERLSARESDILELLRQEEQQPGKHRKKEVELWLNNVQRKKSKFEMLRRKVEQSRFHSQPWLANKVIKLTRELAELCQEGTFPNGLVLAVRSSRTESLALCAKNGQALEQNIKKIWALITNDEILRLAVYGMAGVGKTTLATHIHDLLLKEPERFGHIYWVTVSQDCGISKLQNDIAKKVGLDLSSEDDERSRAALLYHRLLREERTVLMLDDVCKDYDVDRIGIPVGVNRCKLIITSRSYDVCLQMGCKENAVKVEPLSWQESLTLFLDKLDCGNKLTPGIEEIAKKMVKRCDGLPLGIITMAGSMRGLKDINEWKDALEVLQQSSMGQYDMQNKVYPALLYSYRRLRDHRFQNCLLRCSMYPEDMEIPRDRLIRNFISEGLMDFRDRRTKEFHQGHTILNRLESVCLLESGVNSEGEKWVKMHDLVREMAFSINQRTFMVKAGLQLMELPDEREWSEDLIKVSLMANEISEIPGGISPKCPRLSTLILHDNNFEFIPCSFFDNMCTLQVLDLSKNAIELLPDSISNLENLTTLLLGHCYKLAYVPSLQKLKELRELDISYTEIEEVPRGLECLVKLKYLNMKGIKTLSEMPKGLLFKLSALQRLILPLNIIVQAKELEKLKLLEEFEGWVEGTFDPKWFETFQRLSLYGTKADDSDTWYDDFETSHGYICWITLTGCNLTTSKQNVVSLPQDIQLLEMYQCKGLRSCLMDIFPTLYRARDFNCCRVTECEEIEFILKSSSCVCNDDIPLQSLEFLNLYNLPNLIGLVNWDLRATEISLNGTFSSLKVLEMDRCHKARKLFPHSLFVQNFRSLEKIIVRDCDQLDVIIADIEKDGFVDSGSKSSSYWFPESSWSSIFYEAANIVSLPNLRELVLYNLPELKSIYNGFISSDSVEKIDVKVCPKLKILPFHRTHPDGQPPPLLISSSLSSFKGHNEGLNSVTFPSLRMLTLWNLPELESICDGTMICNSIEIISVQGCTKIDRLFLFLPLVNGWPTPPPSLKEIRIKKSEKEWWESLERSLPSAKNILQPFVEYF